MIDTKQAFLVDVRTREEFSEGSVKGAVNIPLDQIEKRLGEFKGKQGVVVFCRSGGRAGAARQLLLKNGIEHVINGGSWQDVNRAMRA